LISTKYIFDTCKTFIVFVAINLLVGSQAFAQVDAGALQQQLQREADQNRPLPQPESLIKKLLKNCLLV